MPHPIRARVPAALLAAATLAVLVVAAWLRPSAHGHGTHTALGLPTCQWVALANKPCPTCGMTTAFAHAADARPAASFLTQPLGALLALITAAVFWGALHAALTGTAAPSLFARLVSKWPLIALALAALAAWVYKIATWPQ
jgi:hypothetical protein